MTFECQVLSKVLIISWYLENTYEINNLNFILLNAFVKRGGLWRACLAGELGYEVCGGSASRVHHASPRLMCMKYT